MSVVEAPALDAVTPDVSALLAGAPRRAQYILTPGVAVPFGDGIIGRGVHTSQTDADGKPLAVLVYEPRGARAVTVPLAVAAYAIASGLISADEVEALQAHGA